MELVVAKEGLGNLWILSDAYTLALDYWLCDTYCPADLHLSACAHAE